ncbi:MAG: gamma-glutamyl-gamma-aminobutyrate hydrolase family protein [Ilumatobacteraceae bacterium]
MPSPSSITVRIGITAHLDLVNNDDGDGILHYVASAPYVKAVLRAGALPVLLPVVDPADAAAMLDVVDALIITGGCDVDPTNYGAAAEPGLGRTDLVRDAADLAITRAAVASNVPTLATCRGIQVLNVAMGGTLTQHIDDHMRIDLYNQAAHDVDIDPASRLAKILGTEAAGVNSLHHQVIDRLGRGVRAVAHNHDGQIEAIEIDAAPAVLGVQWHPELLRHRADHLALFEDLVGQVLERRWA